MKVKVLTLILAQNFPTLKLCKIYPHAQNYEALDQSSCQNASSSMVLTIVNGDGKKDVHSVHHPVFTARHQPQIVQPKRPFGTVGGWVGGGFRG